MGKYGQLNTYGNFCIHSNIYTTVKDIVNSNGYSGLWRGTVPTIMR